MIKKIKVREEITKMRREIYNCKHQTKKDETSSKYTLMLNASFRGQKFGTDALRFFEIMRLNAGMTNLPLKLIHSFNKVE